VKGVLTGVVDVDGGVRIDAVYGDTAAYRVGDVISPNFYETPVAPETRFMMPLTVGGDDAAPNAIKLADGTYTCRSMGLNAVVPISPENYFKAKSAATPMECESRLVKLDDQFAKTQCATGCGCTASDPSSLGILLSIAGVFLARRLR
jgi:hypothetical protein